MNSLAMTMVELECQYGLGRVDRECRLRQAAARYELELERRFAQREQRRIADKRQWLDTTLPGILREAELRKYERGMEAQYV
jgi:hypothetical protein